MKSNILFISHDASRTGAPLLLLHFLRALKQKPTNFNIDIILGFDGPLTSDFEEVGNTFIYKRFRGINDSFLLRIINSILSKIGLNFKIRTESFSKLKAFTNKKYSLIFSNTITNGLLLDQLSHLRCPIITFVHELENSIKSFTTPTALEITLKSTSHFLVPSNAVKLNLQKNHSIPDSKMSLVNYYIPESEVTSDTIKKIKLYYGITNELVVGGTGTSDWRKGVDLFIQVALYVRKIAPDLCIRFIWVGASINSAENDRLAYDITNAGLDKHMYLIGSVNNPIDYMGLFDLFLMTSREDPYPLVVLEAAMQKKPIVYFDNSGGTAEFLSNGIGISVPYLNCYEMAKEAVKILSDKVKCAQLGFKAYEKYKKLHSEAGALPTFEEILQKHLNNL